MNVCIGRRDAGLRYIRTGLIVMSALWAVPTRVWGQGVSPSGGLTEPLGVPAVMVPLPDGGILKDVYSGGYERDRSTSDRTPPESAERHLVLSIGAGYGEGNALWVAVAGCYRASEDFAIEAELGYFRMHSLFIDPFRGRDERTLSDLSVGVHMLVTLPIDDRFEWWVGVGLGLHFIARRETFFPLEASGTGVGVHVKSGVDINLSRHWTVFGAVRGDVIHPHLRSDVGFHVKAYVGGRYRF